ncbi:MAG: aminotransferase class I/II-fold pyridoxal phosphate-dependent enzyme [Clostridiales bacterium]|nr:aminotransferase class I/II-fold pyridoxal phosphate-dependent enzyme [Clostridiales bacterium]
MEFAKRMDDFKPGVFDVLNRLRRERIAAGEKVYDFWIGTPDFPPAPHVMEAFCESGKHPESYRYSLAETPELMDAVIAWYKRRYGVDLTPDEITAVNGSQEGAAHIGWALLNPGDVVLVPNPGYPIFSMGPLLCGGTVEEFPLYEKNNFVLDFNDIPEESAKRAKMIIVSYPANPVAAAADRKFYEDLVAFAKKYDLIVLHDNAYSELIFDGKPGMSFLEVEGAKDVGFEFNSLSKSYNLTGLRISFAIGNKEIIQKFRTVRSQIDYGVPHPVQAAAVAALNGPQDCLDELRANYKARRDALCQGLASIGWPCKSDTASMFVWVKLPAGYTDSEAFCQELLMKSGVMCVPGVAFGSLGEGFVRFALTAPVELIEEAVAAIKDCGILNK